MAINIVILYIYIWFDRCTMLVVFKFGSRLGLLSELLQIQIFIHLWGLDYRIRWGVSIYL